MELAELPPGVFATAEQAEGLAFVSFSEYLRKHLKYTKKIPQSADTIFKYEQCLYFFLKKCCTAKI